MGNLIPNQYAQNEQLTRGNLSGLSTTGSRLMEEKKTGLFGKIGTDQADPNKVIDVNAAYEDLKNNRNVYVQTPDGRQIKITSLEQLKQLNLDDPTAGMGAASRRGNNYASYYNSFTPFWWPKMDASQVSPDGSHLDDAGYAPFMPQQPMFGSPGGWYPFAA